MSRTGLFGGTFDPLHNGHFELVKAALRQGLDRVIVMPSGRPPHKSCDVVSMAGYRYEMACRAFSGMPEIKVSDMEILRPGRSFTLDTIRQLRERMAADDELVLLYGSDMLTQIDLWHEPGSVLAACPVMLADRGGYDDGFSRIKAAELKQKFGARITFFDAPPIELASSQIRRAIFEGQPYGAWLPEKVGQVIKKHQFYRHQDELAEISLDLWQQLYEMERQLWSYLDRKRMLHSLNVMLYSLHLALIHDVSPEQAGVAALLHDSAKCLPDKEVNQLARTTGDESMLDAALAHGPAGCQLASGCFHIGDPAVLHAILYHTTGCAGMTKLDEIIFIADKVEPARTYERLDEIRGLAETDLDQAMLVCLTEIGLFLSREKLTAHSLTQEALDDICRRLAARDSGLTHPCKSS
jgi:nicotinate-nucleotide adenylyltransferase